MLLSTKKLEALVSASLDQFYARRIQKLSTLRLSDTLKRKNPYLFRAIGIRDASEFVEQLLSAYMSSSDEGIFGDAFFEPLARAVSGGVAAPGEGVDVAVEDARRYLALAVKSGPASFNKQSKTRQNEEFNALRNRLFKLQKHFEAVVGYCYGKRISGPSKTKGFRELSGQAFWAEITGDEEFYLSILDAMKDKPAQHKEQYMQAWAEAKNRFVREFTGEFCEATGAINWHKILELNSGRR